MARFAVVYTLHMGGRERRHIVEAWIENAPDGAKTTEIANALKESKYLTDFSERGVFMGNRRVLTDAQLPKEYTATDAKAIAWAELEEPSKAMVQLNVRVPVAERAAYSNAAATEGLKLAEWVRKTLREAASL